VLRFVALDIARLPGAGAMPVWREYARMPGFGAYARQWQAAQDEPVTPDDRDEAWLLVDMIVQAGGGQLPPGMLPLLGGAMRAMAGDAIRLADQDRSARMGACFAPRPRSTRASPASPGIRRPRHLASATPWQSESRSGAGQGRARRLVPRRASLRAQARDRPAIASDFCCIIGSMTTSTMEREETAVRDLFARVDEVLDVAQSIEGERPQEAARLVHVSHGALSSAGPVRVPIAARILLVSDKTVRAWVEEGLLTPRAVRPRLLLDAERLHAVLRFLSDLRAAGQDRDFRDDLWNKLRDEALPDRADLTESVSQMNTGNVRPALTFDEERKGAR
jgi:hypothetical protein